MIWTVWKIRLRRAEAKRTAPAFQAIRLKSGSCFPFRRAWFALEAGLLPPGPANDRHCGRSPRPSLPGFVKSFQLRPEGYLSGRLHLIELYHMSTLVHVHIQHRTGAEQNMLHRCPTENAMFRRSPADRSGCGRYSPGPPGSSPPPAAG